jgi:drug/metabolite transporter (DMT)-like permease
MDQMGRRQIGAQEWALFALCVALWGSAYAMVSLALRHGADPWVIVAARLWMATGLLHGLLWLLRARGQAPAATPGVTGKLAVLGLFGAAIPFACLSFAQVHIASSLAGIIAAITPILVGVTAPLVTPGDRVTVWRVAGLALGFVGVIALMGVEALASLGGPSFWGQLAAAVAAISYAVNTLIARAGVAIPPLEAAAGWTFFGALFASPFALAALWAGAWPDAIGWACIVGLAIGPTAIASVAYFQLLRAAGPAFVTQTNYAIPIWAVALGAVAFGERLPGHALAAAGLIAAGLFVAQEGWRGLTLKR